MLAAFRKKYVHFKILLDSNSQLLNIISDIEEKLRGVTPFGLTYVRSQSVRILFYTGRMIRSFEGMTGKNCTELHAVLDNIYAFFKQEDELPPAPFSNEITLPYSKIEKNFEWSVGGKNANLAEIRNHVHLPVPAGFAITTHAFRRFIDSRALVDKIRQIKEKLDIISPENILQVSQSIEAMLLSADVPEDIVVEIRKAIRDLALETGQSETCMKVALRSSAVGEDSEFSFAGQYLSVMNVPSAHIISEYKRVLASLFSERAITYRQHMGIPFEEAAMSVACIEMVQSTVSGVMYSRHPFIRSRDQVIIHAIWGLGAYIVDGIVSPDIFVLSRTTPPVLLDKSISNKPVSLVPDEAGFLSEKAVEENLRQVPCLSDDQAIQLAEYGLQIETHFGQAQDIEWAINPHGKIIILQSRPLHQTTLLPDGPSQLKEAIPGYELLVESGSIACQGVGCGPAHIVKSEADLLNFPDHGVLVAPRSYPQYVLVMGKAQAIVTDSGSLTGHMASLSREFNVPALLNTRIATSRIQPGELITVDALSGRVYRGRVTELLEETFGNPDMSRKTPVYNILRRRADWIIPLNLVDPKSVNFQAINCKTVHDIMRFLHERSYTEIFSISDQASDHLNATVRLNAPLMLDLYIIDLGGGIHEQAFGYNTITVDQIHSPPFLALLRGMMRKEFQNSEPRPVDLGGFFSVMTRQLVSPPNLDTERFGDKSYAIISNKYVNFSSRVGYHYSILDAYCGNTATKNYVNFQFKGGAADDIRRHRRARSIQRILEHLGFVVATTGDRVTARYAKDDAVVIEDKLDYIGRLLMYSRQMDMLMKTEESVLHLADQFLEGNYMLDRQKNQAQVS
ncbi:MAG: PEP/pyruvate-binding domain-containing protein [Desulfatirhabdiaceae bacterium]